VALNLTLIMTLINLLMVGVFPAVWAFSFFLSFFFAVLRFRVRHRVLLKVCHDFNGGLRGWLDARFPSLIRPDLLRFNFKFNKSHGFSTFLHNQDSKTKPKQKRNLNQKKKIRGGAPKKCVKEFAYSLCRLKKIYKGKAKFNLRKSCLRYGFIR